MWTLSVAESLFAKEQDKDPALCLLVETGSSVGSETTVRSTGDIWQRRQEGRAEYLWEVVLWAILSNRAQPLPYTMLVSFVR